MDFLQFDHDLRTEFPFNFENREDVATRIFPPDDPITVDQVYPSTGEVLNGVASSNGPVSNWNESEFLELFGLRSGTQAHVERTAADIDDCFRPNSKDSEQASQIVPCPGSNSKPLVHNSPYKKSSVQADKKANLKDVLRAWVAENPGNLYPSNATKRFLSQTARSTVKQVSTWFANYRQRRIKPILNSSVCDEINPPPLPAQHVSTALTNENGCRSRDGRNSSDHASSYRVAAPSSPQRPLSASKTEDGISEYKADGSRLMFADLFREGFDLVATWCATLPEDNCYDPVEEYPDVDLGIEGQQHHTADIHGSERGIEVDWEPKPLHTVADDMETYRAASLYPEQRLSNELQRQRPEVEESTYRKLHRTASSVGSWQSNHWDRASAGSGGSIGSGASMRSWTSRRGRRMSQYTPRSEGRYRCSFCGQGFRRKGDMKRHLDSICNPTRKWVCRPTWHIVMPTSPLTFYSPVCLCGSEALTCKHQMQPCWDKPEIERTFYRRDHFTRHMQDTHGMGTVTANFWATELEQPYENVATASLPTFASPTSM